MTIVFISFYIKLTRELPPECKLLYDLYEHHICCVW